MTFEEAVERLAIDQSHNSHGHDTRFLLPRRFRAHIIELEEEDEEDEEEDQEDCEDCGGSGLITADNGILEFRKGKLKPGDIYWYTGFRSKNGSIQESSEPCTYKHPVEVMSFPVWGPMGPIRLFVRHTPGDPTTARWALLSQLGEQIVTPQANKR